jgi:hypothetical protein
VVESHVLQVREVLDAAEEEEEVPHDIFEVFAAERRKRDNRPSKTPELASLQDTKLSTSDVSTTRPSPQFRYQSNAEGHHLVSELEDYLMQGKLSLTTPAHVFAASPIIRKDVVDKLRLRRVESGEHEVTRNAPNLSDVSGSAADDKAQTHLHMLAPTRPLAFCLPLQELDVLVNNDIKVTAILNTGSQIIVIRQDLIKALGVPINTRRTIKMEGANGATNWTVGCVEFLTMQVGNVPFKVHAHVVENTNYSLLLGRPFQQALLCRFEDLPGGEVEVSIRDPANIARRVYIPTRSRSGRAPAVKSLCVIERPASLPPSSLDSAAALPTPPPLPPPDPATLVYKYKRVDKKVRPVLATLAEDFRNIRRIPVDPLLSLPPLLTHPPDFAPGERLTQERLDELALNAHGFLWPEELKLLYHVLKVNELGLAWTEVEKGRFSDEYFSPVKIPVVEHVPWAHKNIPIPSGILGDVIQIFKDKYAAGVYEHSDASYRSRWFCVKKKSGALRLVHDLQPLNAITVRNSGVPPIADQVIEAMAGRSCYTMLDLFVGYDHRTLDVTSRDLTTIQSPIGAVRLTCLPQGWTNAGAIFHEDVTFILKPEIPDVAWPFMDDCSIKGPATRYETSDGGYETTPANHQIRRFVWEHLNDVHRILHRLRCAGSTVSAAPAPPSPPRSSSLPCQKSSSSATSATMRAASPTTPRPPRSATGPRARTSRTSAPSSGSQVICAYGSRITRPSPAL